MGFDTCALDYETQLGRGLKISGRDPTWFARQRVDFVAAYFDQTPASPGTIMEFGCGVGNHVPFLRDAFNGSRMVGVDISRHSLAIARQRHADANVQFCTPTGFDEEGSIDLVFVNGVFHHIPAGEHVRWLKYIRHVLKPGGTLAFFENNPFSLPARLVMKLIPFDRDAVMVHPYRFSRLLADSGFRLVDRRFHFIFPRSLGFLRCLEPSLASIPLGAQYSLLAYRTT